VTDEHQPEQPTLQTLTAFAIVAMRLLGTKGVLVSAREMRDAATVELVVVRQRGGVSFGVGEER
jgi:hypothetical protein